MAGNIKQAISTRPSLLPYLIAGGYADNLVLKVQSELLIHSEIPWSGKILDCLRFCRNGS